jgi:hypothetical protein
MGWILGMKTSENVDQTWKFGSFNSDRLEIHPLFSTFVVEKYTLP